MPALTSQLSDRFGEIFAELGLPARFGQVVTSSRPDLGQFQCNGALAAAKAGGGNPRALAERLIERLRQMPILRDLSLAGPGFVNFSLSDAYLAEIANRIAADPRLGHAATPHPQRVVLDYGGANIAKPMHVGHLRAAIIGDSLRRIFAFAGDKTWGDVHMGDWGLQMGMLVSELEIARPDLPYFDPAFSGPYPATSPVTIDELAHLYPQASKACKSDPERLERARRATAELQAGRPGYRALWQHFFDISVVAMKRDYGDLGVHFDLWKGEACVNDLIPPMIAAMRQAGIAEESEGALVIRVAEPDDKHEIPPLILVKSDGAVMYATTDLATIIDRVAEQNPDRIIYVVDHRQHLHFVQVFRAAERAGIASKARMFHLGYGTMNGTDGRPFKTREGGVMRLDDLIRMIAEAANRRLDEQGLGINYEPGEKEAVARKVGIAALKFADLSNNPIANYVFDLDRFSRFEGKTGPYLLYAAVRIKSLLRKAAAQGDYPGAILPPEPGERDLFLALAEMPAAIDAAHADLAPHRIADFAYSLAQSFSAYYNAFHILSEADPARRRSRLAIADLVLKELALSLDLLGIELPERM